MSAPREPTAADWIMLFSLATMWGMSFMFIELALRSFTPAVIVAARVAIAAAALLAVLAATGRQLPRQPRDWLLLGGMAMLGTVIPFGLIAWAQQYIQSALTGILMATMPLFVLALAHVFVPGSRLTAARVAGFVLGFSGVTIIMGFDVFAGATGNRGLLAPLAVLAAAFSYALNTIVARRVGTYEPITLACGTLIAGVFLSLPAASFDLGNVTWPPAGLSVFAVGVLGLLSTGLATIFYFRLVQGPGPAFVSLVNYMVPALAVVAGAFVLEESLSPRVYWGLGMILASIAISEFGHRAFARGRRFPRTRRASTTSVSTREV